MWDRFFKNETDREEMKETIALFKPQIKQLKAEADAERVQEQKSKFPLLDGLAQRCQAEIPTLQAEVQQLSEKEEKLRAALQEATKAHSRAASDLALRSNWFDHQENLLWSAIRQLAPAVIVERQKKWRDLVEETRRKLDSEERSTRPDLFGRWHYVFVSNLPNVQRRVGVITAAIKSAEELKVQALPESEIIEKLNALEETFPPLTNARETTTVLGPDTSELRRATW